MSNGLHVEGLRDVKKLTTDQIRMIKKGMALATSIAMTEGERRIRREAKALVPEHMQPRSARWGTKPAASLWVAKYIRAVKLYHRRVKPRLSTMLNSLYGRFGVRGDKPLAYEQGGEYEARVSYYFRKSKLGNEHPVSYSKFKRSVEKGGRIWPKITEGMVSTNVYGRLLSFVRDTVVSEGRIPSRRECRDKIKG